MRNHFDHLAKQIGKEALGPSGATVAHDEISPETQHADLRHEPDPAREAERARLGLLGRIASVLCLIEVYGHAPSAEELRACLTKHFAFWRERTRKARARNKKRKERGEPPEDLVEPFLWIITAVTPSALLLKLKPEPARGWPPGVLFFGDDALRVGIVLANELPRDRSTLLVRLMAAGPLLAGAIEELARLPVGAHERVVAEQILLSLKHALGSKPSRTPEEQAFVETMLETWEQARVRGVEEGRAEGRADGEARALLTVLRARGIPVSAEEQARIVAERDLARLERWLQKATSASSLADVLDEPRRGPSKKARVRR